MQIAEKYGLNLEQAAQVAAVATGFIVKECEKDIGGEVGYYVATLGFIEGSKTVPPPLERALQSIGEKKPWYKFW